MKNWELRYPKRLAPTGIYRNLKTGQHIQVGGKQLKSPEFKEDAYPFYIEERGHPVRTEKWFADEKTAKKYLKHYMRKFK